MPTGINDGTTPLLVVVRALGEYLTSSEADLRLKGQSRCRDPAATDTSRLDIPYEHAQEHPAGKGKQASE